MSSQPREGREPNVTAGTSSAFDPARAMAEATHEFGEHGGVNMSIEASTTFTVMDARTMPEIFQGRAGPDAGGCYLYGRHFNPTVYALGHAIAAMERTESAYPTSSGLSAIAATVMQLTEPGDHVVASDTLYGGTHALLHDYLPKRTGLRTTFVDITDPDAVRGAMTSRTRLVYTEAISNPTLTVADLPALADVAHKGGAKLVVDNTFSPLVVTPALHGADIVVHSLTKYINGASDIIAGVICGPRGFISELMDLHQGSLMLLGPTMDPQTAFQISLRLPHLPMRMAEHARRAQTFAERLAEMDLPVAYPGLDTHPQRDLLDRLRNDGYGFGGMLTLDLGSTERAFAFMEHLQNVQRFGYMAVSLGYFDTLMSCSASSTSSEMGPEDLKQAGIAPGLVRLSIGYTGSLEQRWTQLLAGLRAVGMTAVTTG